MNTIYLLNLSNDNQKCSMRSCPIMKCLWILIIILVVPDINAQVYEDVKADMNFAYPSIAEAVTIKIPNQSCDQLFMLTSNGVVNKLGTGSSGCDFSFIPAKIGTAQLKVYKLVKKDTIWLEEIKYYIEKWPEQRAQFAGRESGTVQKGEFLANRGVFIPIKNFDMSGNIPVKSYAIKVMRGKSMIMDLTNIGEPLEASNRQKLSQLTSGDIVIFDNIVSRMPGEPYDKKMNSIKLQIE